MVSRLQRFSKLMGSRVSPCAPESRPFWKGNAGDAGPIGFCAEMVNRIRNLVGFVPSGAGLRRPAQLSLPQRRGSCILAVRRKG